MWIHKTIKIGLRFKFNITEISQCDSKMNVASLTCCSAALWTVRNSRMENKTRMSVELWYKCNHFYNVFFFFYFYFFSHFLVNCIYENMSSQIMCKVIKKKINMDLKCVCNYPPSLSSGENIVSMCNLCCKVNSL